MFDLPLEQLGTATVWLAVILYSFQIYYDFSGYSDMAIGLGRMLMYRYCLNQVEREICQRLQNSLTEADRYG